MRIVIVAKEPIVYPMSGMIMCRILPITDSSHPSSSLFDSTSSALIFLGYAIPGFVVALVLISTVAVNVSEA